MLQCSQINLGLCTEIDKRNHFMVGVKHDRTLTRAAIAACSTHLEVADVPVAATGVPTAQDRYLHTIVGGPEGAPAMVLVPGYGAGAGARASRVQGNKWSFMECHE